MVYARWDEAYRHAHRTLPSYNCYRHPILFLEKHTANGAVSRCVLCEKDLATHLDRDAHCNDEEHKHRVNIVDGLQQNMIAMHCAMLQNRMDDEMPDRHSQIPVQLDMFWTLLNCHPSKQVLWYPKILTNEASAMIDGNILKRRMCLLELAVWKAMCLLHMVVTPTGDYHALQDWCRCGWKANKSAKRNSNEIGIIVRAVLPFVC
jgi:hypothetical protein